MVRLSEYNLGTCKGCRICFDKGEEYCPYKDDRDKGWFESDYFYPVKLNPFKKLSGKIFDKLAIQIIRS